MKKVLISVYACTPNEGSEPGIGWNQVLQSAKKYEVWAITRSNNRPAIEEYVSMNPTPQIHWLYYDLPRWASRWKKGIRGMRFYYVLWQCGVYRRIRSLHCNINFDLVHHVTFVNYWMPTLLAFLSAPFVWGPIGGGESIPRQLRRGLPIRGRLTECIRDLARRLGEVNPVVRLTAKRAALALATTPETEQRLKSLGSSKTRVFPAIGLPQDELERLSRIQPRELDVFRVVSIGRLLYWKGLDLGMRAFARLLSEHPNSEYWIIGDGPERSRLLELASLLGIEAHIRFIGSISRDRVLSTWSDCHVLLFPSLHDSGGGACLEAMAAGKPVVCLDIGGPALQVTSETGFRILPRTPEQVVSDLARALTALATDRQSIVRLGETGRRRVREQFNWDLKGKEIAKIYDSLCAPDNITPIFESTQATSHPEKMQSSGFDRI